MQGSGLFRVYYSELQCRIVLLTMLIIIQRAEVECIFFSYSKCNTVKGGLCQFVTVCLLSFIKISELPYSFFSSVEVTCYYLIQRILIP